MTEDRRAEFTEAAKSRKVIFFPTPGERDKTGGKKKKKKKKQKEEIN